MVGIYRILKLNRMIGSNRLKLLLILAAQLLHRRYYSIRIDPIVACNLRCRMCYFSGSRKSERAHFAPAEIDTIAENTFGGALQVVVGCGAEPTMYKGFVDIVRKAKRAGVPSVSLVTNAQLITKSQLDELVDAGLDELIVSVHGATAETYEHFMVGAKWEKLMTLLEGFNGVGAGKTALRINYTANPHNYMELLNFFDIFAKYNVATLQVRPVMAIGGEYEQGFTPEHTEQYRDVMLKLRAQCALQGVRLLANIDNPGYTGSGRHNPVVAETYKYISPGVVIEKGYEWRSEPYRKYQIRSGWREKILRQLLCPGGHSTTDDLAERYSGRYDVF